MRVRRFALASGASGQREQRPRVGCALGARIDLLERELDHEERTLPPHDAH